MFYCLFVKFVFKTNDCSWLKPINEMKLSTLSEFKESQKMKFESMETIPQLDL